MNYTTNDQGMAVIAIGAPGSIERIKVEYPALLERLNQLFNCEAKIDEAIEVIRQAGIMSEMETSNLLAASHYGDNPSIVRSLIYSVTRTGLRQFCDTYRASLAKCLELYPGDYSWPKEQLQSVGDKMVKAIERGSFNKDGQAFRMTCKELNIPHTYKAIAAFIAS